MDFDGEYFFALDICELDVQKYLDEKYGGEYIEGICLYWGYETQRELDLAVNVLRSKGEPIPLELRGGGVPEKFGTCLITKKKAMCRVMCRAV